jgi:hypothetical protein
MDQLDKVSDFLLYEKERLEMTRRAIAALENTKPRQLSVTEALNLRSELVDNMHELLSSIGHILMCHESTIQKRWFKWKQEQRRAILLKSWGSNMALHHRPDWHAIYGQTDKNETESGIALMYPYINQEDLVKPRSLLLFLQSRGKHHRGKFAAADLEAMHLGVSMKRIGAGLLPGYVMMFTNHKQIARYGELVQVGTISKADGQPHVNRGIPVSDGLLILQVQHSILHFLNGCVRNILHDYSTDDIIKSPIMPQPALPVATDTGFASLAVMAAEAPYRLPENLDWDRIVSLLAAKSSQAADHLRSLREDPGYFYDYAYERHEHRVERLPSEQGLANKDLEPKNEVKYWTKVLWDAIYIDYMHFETFSELHRQAEVLQQMYASNAALIQPDRDLPEAFMHAILRFRYYLNENACIMSQRVPVSSSPPWREHFYCTVVHSKPGFECAIVDQKEPSQFDDFQERLYMYLFRLIGHKKRASANHGAVDVSSMHMKLVGLTTVMDVLQHFLESEPRAKSMMTPLLASSIGEIAIISECLRQLEIYQPWARTFDAFFTEERDKAFQLEYREHTDWAGDRLSHAFARFGQSFGRLGAPTNGRFSYPVEKRMTKENVAALRRAESHLDAFWQAFDKPVIETFRSLEKTAIRRFLLQPRVLQRTPAWIEPPKSKPSVPQIPYTSFAELELNRRHLTERTVSNEELKPFPKAKNKTRGIASQVEVQQEEIDPQEDQDHSVRNETPSFSVDSRALKVFKTIFYTPSITATPGEVKWLDFLHAMTSVGFVPEKLYGSVWHFRPSAPGLDRSINFHEPHKEGKGADKIPYSIARGIGRRLNRAYGWDGAKFSLAEK